MCGSSHGAPYHLVHTVDLSTAWLSALETPKTMLDGMESLVAKLQLFLRGEANRLQ